MRIFYIFFLQLFLINQCYSQTTLNGKVSDVKTGELLIGATIKSIILTQSSVTGLNGSFSFKNIKEGKYKFTCSYLGYQTIDTLISVKENTPINIQLKSASSELNMVTVVGKRDAESDIYARKTEKESLSVINVISAKTILLSPDITVANVLQRVSGVSLERSSSGDGRYAIIRGMDKRYNYTLINGVKIPSPDNKNRYVPLDIFPADLVERIEVSKTLTPNMEGDAIGGTVNLVMKNAPDYLYLQGSISSGFSQTILDNGHQQFPVSAINLESPFEKYGSTYSAKPSDFTRDNLKYTSKSFLPNTIANLSIGNRFFDKKLGMILGASYQNSYSGYSSVFNPGEYQEAGVLYIKNNYTRSYSGQLTRTGLNAKLDYNINPKNRLSLYSFYAILDDAQTRLTVDTLQPAPRNRTGTGQIWYYGRSKFQRQSIYNATLQGNHDLITEKLKLNWSGVYSLANSQIPDLAEYEYDGGFYTDPSTPNAPAYTHPNVLQNFDRTWWKNNDRDLAGYLDLIFNNKFKSIPYTLSTGGLYRTKHRDNFYQNYQLRPTTNSDGSKQEWSGIDNFTWTVFNPSGSPAQANNYRVNEDISAAYAMLKFNLDKLETTFGVRSENTSQDFETDVPVTQAAKTGSISYMDILPSVAFKYLLNPKTNLRLSYFASISRPGFFEIVPYNFNGDDFSERGNPLLKHTQAHNLDIRYEYFPKPNEQIFIGAFYKQIKNPIEYGFQFTGSQSATVYQPNNFGDATNFGLEFVYEKYIRQFGLRANYTFTNSSITTTKVSTEYNGGILTRTFPEEKRALQGQSAHIANIALLYKNQKIGLDFQLAWQFTGNRIVLVSPYYGFDYHQKDLHLFDFSADKKLGKKLVVFIKVKNILNAPYEVYINKAPSNTIPVPDQNIASGKTLAQKDLYGQNYQYGLRYTL